MEDVPTIETTHATVLRGADAAGDDAALVRAARTDPAAFGLLYQRYRARIYWYLRGRCRSDEDAADLAQQVFMQAWRAVPGYRERGLPVAAWLFRIARNAAANASRRGDLLRVPLPELIDPAADADPERVILRHEAAEWLGALVQRLPADKRELLALRFAAGLSMREIAAVLGVREATIKKRLSRTIRALKEQYDAAAG